MLPQGIHTESMQVHTRDCHECMCPASEPGSHLVYLLPFCNTVMSTLRCGWAAALAKPELGNYCDPHVSRATTVRSRGSRKEQLVCNPVNRLSHSICVVQASVPRHSLQHLKTQHHSPEVHTGRTDAHRRHSISIQP